MSNPFYIAAVYAAREDSDGLRIATGVSLVHPWGDGDANDLALASARLQYPATEGWKDHYVRVEALAPALVDTIAAEAGLTVPERAVVATVLTPSHRVEPDIEDEA